MNINLSTLKSLLMQERKSVKEIKITLTQEDFSRYEDEVAKRIAKRVRIHGFRPGKAPLDVVKRMYGERIMEEAVERALNEKVNEVVENNNWKLITPPRVKAHDRKDGDHEFTVEFEIVPDFNLPDLTSITVKKRIKRVTDSDVDERINEYKENNAQLKAVNREIKEGDMVLAQYIFKSKDGKEEGPKRARIFVKSDELDEELYNALIGKKAGDQITLETEDGAEIYKIQNVYEKIYPSDDEIAELLGYTSVDEMREKIRQQLVEEYNEMAEAELENNIINEIYKLSPFDPPPTLVSEIYKDVKRQLVGKVSPEELEKTAQNLAVFRAITEIILLKLIEEKNIDVSEEDIEEYLKEEGHSDPKGFIRNAKRRNKLNELKSRYIIRKAFDYIKNLVKVEPEFVS